MSVNMIPMIHRFSLNDSYFLFDTNSGALMQISGTCYELLSGVESAQLEFESNGDFSVFLQQNRQQLQHYRLEHDLAAAVSELEYLNHQGIIFSELTLNCSDMVFNNTGVKALCIHPVHDCNMNCSYCFAEGGSYSQQTSYMSSDTANAAVDFLINKSGNRKNLEIDFFGGEPLLNFPVIVDTVKYAQKRAREAGKTFKFTVTTNGLALSEEIMDFLVYYRFALVFSLDGRREIHDTYRVDMSGNGTYDKIVPKFKKMVSKMLASGYKEYYIRGTYTGENLDFANDVFSIADKGFERISLEPVTNAHGYSNQITSTDLPKIKSEYTKIVKASIDRTKNPDKIGFDFFHFNVNLENGPCTQKKITGCGAGFEYLAVDPAGNLFPCHQFVDIDEYFIGNVVNEDQLNENISQKLQNANLTTKIECARCWAKFLCGGGCHANSINSGGSLYFVSNLDCSIKKLQFEHALYKRAHNIE